MCFLHFYLDSLHLIRELQFIIHIFLKHWSWCSKKLHDTFCRSCDILTNLWLRLVSDALILQNLTVGYSWARQLKQPFMASHASTFCKFIIYKEGFNLAINFNRPRLTKALYKVFYQKREMTALTFSYRWIIMVTWGFSLSISSTKLDELNSTTLPNFGLK